MQVLHHLMRYPHLHSAILPEGTVLVPFAGVCTGNGSHRAGDWISHPHPPIEVGGLTLAEADASRPFVGGMYVGGFWAVDIPGGGPVDFLPRKEVVT